jgi:parallel beta-helix repeat protein
MASRVHSPSRFQPLARRWKNRFRYVPLIAGAAVCAGCGGAGSVLTPANPATPTAAPASSLTVSSLNDSGTGSLRAAIVLANAQTANASVGKHAAASGLSHITFTVRGTITLASDLPAIRTKTTIDGTSAPAFSGTTPVVEINANSHAAVVFAPGSAGSQLLGVAVDNASGPGVTLDASSITLDADYIGVNLAGAAFGNRGDGVYISPTSSNNLIGLNPKAASGVVANVISGNTGNGLSLHESSGNVVVDNRIGTNAAGSAPISNSGDGIWITTASHDNEIGGTAYIDTSTGQANNPTGNKGTVPEVYVVPPLGNLISGNGQNGVRIDTGSRNNVLNGNFIGTRADGDAPIGNIADGVLISHADDNTLAGCQFVNNPFVYYNVLAGNGENGLHVTSSNNVLVQANFFGTGANNTTLVPNKGDGILVDGSSRNTQVGGVIPLGNVSAGNGLNGIEVTGTASYFETFNTFGGLLAFKGAAPNGNDGILITSTGGNQTVRTNVFSGNAANGIEIAGNASGVTVDPDMVGLNTIGNAILSNKNDGLLIDGTAHDNVIGGYLNSVIRQNTFSGNGVYGVAIAGQAHDNQVFNSYIGTSVSGLDALGNRMGGVYIGGTAKNNTIGGANTDKNEPQLNLISANFGIGVTLTSGSSWSRILNNEIGRNRVGLPTLPNVGLPIVVYPGSLHNTIAGN